MSYFRVNIYLSLKDFFKGLISRDLVEQKIENLISKNSKKKYFITTSQLRIGFVILLKFLKKKHPLKKEIIFQPFNLPEMINIADKIGYKIKFLKLNTVDAQPDINFLKTIINKKTMALVATNIFHTHQTLNFLKKLCKQKNIILIEDNAIYFDNYHIRNNKKTYSGSYGDYSLYSFNIMKNISAFFGGGVATNDKKFKVFANKEILKYKNFNKVVLIKQIIIFFILKILKISFFYKIFLKIIRNAHLKKIKFILKIVYPSLKFKKIKFPNYYFTKIAKISQNTAYLQLKNKISRKENHINRRKRNIYYHNLFKKLKIAEVKIFKIEDFNFQNFMDFPIVVERKDQLNNYLLSNGLEIKHLFYHDCAKIFNYKLRKNVLNNSKQFDKIIGLPNHHNITEIYMTKLVKKIKDFYEVEIKK